MQKKVLSEIALYYGDVAMPKNWDIDRDKLQDDILKSQVTDSHFPFSRTLDMLNTYMRDHINLEYGFNLINKETWGNMYKPQETTIPLLNIDPVDLRNSPDYTLLYGVKVKDCNVRIHYEDNRRKGRSWDIPLENNKFIMFPSTNMYYLTNNQKDNFFQFTFVFLDEKGINCSKEIMNIINIVLSKIKYNKLTAVKANLLTKTKNIIEHGFHIDQNIGTTGILYLDNSNGYTKFENGKKIKSEENKYVEFDSTLKHTGSSCTDEKRRIVINFNYQ